MQSKRAMRVHAVLHAFGSEDEPRTPSVGRRDQAELQPIMPSLHGLPEQQRVPLAGSHEPRETPDGASPGEGAHAPQGTDSGQAAHSRGSSIASPAIFPGDSVSQQNRGLPLVCTWMCHSINRYVVLPTALVW